MTRFVSTLLLAFVLAGWTLVAPAQAQSPSVNRINGIGSVNFNVGIPTGDFADNIEDPGFGGDIYFGAQFGQSPVVLGLDLGFLIYGRSERTVPFSTTVPIRVDLVTTNSIVQPHLSLRLQPPTGPIRPYIEGLGGFKYLFTETKVGDIDRNDDRDIASETNFDDFAWSGGGGAGIDFIVYRPDPTRKARQGSKIHGIGLHLGAQYLFGQEAEYVAEGEIEDENGNNVIDVSELDIRRSATNLVILKLGATFYF